MDKIFDIKVLDIKGKDVIEEYLTIFKKLRHERDFMPPEFYKTATDYYLASCKFQLDSLKNNIEHFSEQHEEYFELQREIDWIKKWRKNNEEREDFYSLPGKFPPFYHDWKMWQWILGGFVVVVVYSALATAFSPLNWLKSKFRKKDPPPAPVERSQTEKEVESEEIPEQENKETVTRVRRLEKGKVT